MNRPAGKPTVTIKNWHYYNRTLSGNAYGHPRFADGDFVYTSPVLSILKDAEDVFLVETLNTNYLIEPPPLDEAREVFTDVPMKEDAN
jgi:hypothetical protein